MGFCLERILDDGARSPFTRLVATEIYDGPTAGLVICDITNESYVFRLQAWDDDQKRRVFSLAALDDLNATELLASLRSAEEPRWPEWWLGAPPDNEKRALVNEALTRALSAAGPVVAVLVTDDLLGTIETAARIEIMHGRLRLESLSRRGVPDAEVSQGSFADWLQFIREARGDA